ncbi:hypothetical protein [Streptomyces sparsogenes]|uniref:Uncharacterized protein n=1 Tax=Streptomyces sparsogenes DSM 40356 TaxID=1331668 RepID=A0A1R1S854_9ACTN|nr:hypothetical protein [Streptomyces sparsogenes]OMI34417.1 hypothetical protein SPAR_36576 [Streptomyces sparsogenes DSM 40356]
MNRSTTLAPLPTATVLFDGDAASDSPRVARLRALTLVPDLDAEDRARADIVTTYVTARARGDVDAMATAYLEAAAMDEARPGEPSLIAELDAAGVGDLAEVA